MIAAGRQSAAIRVAAADDDVGSANVALDLRVDDHPRPIDELDAAARAARAATSGSTPEESRLPLEGELLDELRDLLVRASGTGRRRAAGRAGVAAAPGSRPRTSAARWWGETTLDPFVLEQLRAAAARVGLT